jgi:hypothetical protein
MVYMVYKVQQEAWVKTIRMIAARYKLMVGGGSVLCWVQMVARFTGRERESTCLGSYHKQV